MKAIIYLLAFKFPKCILELSHVAFTAVPPRKTSIFDLSFKDVNIETPKGLIAGIQLGLQNMRKDEIGNFSFISRS